MNLTQERLQELFNYNSDTGIVTTKLVRPGSNSFIGKPVGTVTPNRYLCVRVDNRNYQLHTLIWLLTHGKFPNEDIDHIDGNRRNNILSNLRAVSRQDNLKNIAKHRDNTSGILGVSWDKTRNKWKASIYANGKQILLGRYTSKEEASIVRKKADILYGFHPNHGRVNV
jgi:hypothetical protein